jgi:hypothetical protein
MTEKTQTPVSLPAPTVSALRKLAAFGTFCLAEMRTSGGGDLDGGMLQDEALEIGVLETRTISEPCGDTCDCAEFHGEEGMKGGVDCHFIPDEINAAMWEATSKYRPDSAMESK